MIEVKLREGESFDSLLKRFSRKVQQSGVVIRARKTRYYTRTKSKNLKRVSALRRLENQKKREEMKRLGLLPTRR